MFYDKINKYKSWSNLKKQMNDLICDSLKDRISYHYTSYREVHNVYGRATINYDKKEMVGFSWDMGYEQWKDEREVLDEQNVNVNNFDDLCSAWQKQKMVQEELMKNKWMIEGTLCEADFINSITDYLNTNIESALYSDNYLLRVFAYMDRRTGKRTLIKIKEDVENLPEWVKQFYYIRCEAEGI